MPRGKLQTPPTDTATDDVYYEDYDDATDEEPATAPPLFLPPQAANRLIFTVGSAEYLLNGQTRTSVGAAFIDPVTDRMMIPLRTVVEATGAQVEWDDVTRSAILHLPTDTITMPVANPLPDGMGMPLLINDRVFVPLRFIMYALGKDVEWDDANRAGVITW